MKRLGTMLCWSGCWSRPWPFPESGLLDQFELYASKYGVFYQIFVRSFADGDGDGLGIRRALSSAWITF